MVRCCVPGCKSDTNRILPNYQPATLHKFPFPSDRNERKKWLQSIGITTHRLSKEAVVCQHHFLDSYFVPKEENIDAQGRPLKKPKLVKGK